MNAKDKQEVRDMLAESLEHRASTILSLSGLEDEFAVRVLRDEARYLRGPADQPEVEGASRFEGVKYITLPDCKAPFRCVTPDVFEAVYHRPLAAGLVAFKGRAGGILSTSYATPWHPKKDDKVWSDQYPDWGLGIVTGVPADPAYRSVLWPGRVGVTAHPLSDLRPFSFAPPACQPVGREEEKPGFEDIESSVCAKLKRSLLQRTDLNDQEAECVTLIIRDHFRNQAAAKAEGQT